MKTLRTLTAVLALGFTGAGIAADDVPVIELGVSDNNRNPAAVTGAAPSGGELVMIIQQLQDEVRNLRGQLEEQNYKLKQMDRQQLDRYRDLDRRISSLSNAAVSQPAPTQPATNNTPPPAATAAAKPAPSQPDSALDDSQAYRDAFTLVRERKFDQAESSFADFIRLYPQSPRLPNAYYWLGEVRLALQKPEQARESFTQVVTAYSDHRKAPDAAYKLGIVYDQLGDRDTSRKYLDMVINQYPDSSAVRLAKEFKRLQ